MKTLLTNLTLQEATEAIQGTTNTMYRGAWTTEYSPAEVAIGFDEYGELYDVADDVEATLSLEDIMAKDWCVLADTDADIEKWEEGMRHVLEGFRLMEDTQVDEFRFMFWKQLGTLLTAHFGEQTLGRFVETGKLVHNSKCECPDCRIERFQKNPEEELHKTIEQLADLLGVTQNSEESAQTEDTTEELALKDFLKYLHSGSVR